MGHWWQVVHYGQGPSGQDTKWKCRRCGSTTTFWKEPEPSAKVQNSELVEKQAHGRGEKAPYDALFKWYTCEELLPMIVELIAAEVHDA